MGPKDVMYTYIAFNIYFKCLAPKRIVLKIIKKPIRKVIKVIARKGKKGRKCRGRGNNIKFINLKYTKLVEMAFSATDSQLNKRNYDFSLK